MRLYRILNKRTGQVQLIEANTGAQAVNHVVRNQYAVDVPSPMEAAQLAADGIKPQRAGQPVPEPELERDTRTGDMLEQAGA